MTFAFVVGTLLAGAVVVAVVRRELAARGDSRPLELGVKKNAAPKSTN